MNNLGKLTIIMVSFAALAACARTSPPDTAADQAAIRAVQNSWYKAYNSGDGAHPSGPEVRRRPGVFVAGLAVCYSATPGRHTTLGAASFHFRVRHGIGWFPLALAAGQPVRGS